MSSDQRGVISPLALLIVLTFTLLGSGTLYIHLHSQRSILYQLELDRCVGVSAQKLKASLIRLVSENRAIQITRAALMTASTVAPQTVPALKAALEIAVAAQELERTRWILTQKTWPLSMHCPKPSVFSFSQSRFPDFPYRRPAPDLWGPRPLELAAQGPLRLSVHGTTLGIRRHSRATLIPPQEVPFHAPSPSHSSQTWSIRWGAPSQALHSRPDTH